LKCSAPFVTQLHYKQVLWFARSHGYGCCFQGWDTAGGDAAGGLGVSSFHKQTREKKMESAPFGEYDKSLLRRQFEASMASLNL